MSTTISPQVRILVLVGILAAVGLAASMLLRGHSSSPTADTAASRTRPTRTHAASTTPAPTHPTPTHRVTKARPAPAHARHAHIGARGYHGYRVYANLPRELQWQLAHHRVVVVSLYNPSSDVDAISVAEAHAGAADAHVGFLLVSVLDNKVAGILTALRPDGNLLPDPGVLVYRAPGKVAVELDGFADRAAVAQAALNALAGATTPVAASTTAATPSTTPATVAP